MKKNVLVVEDNLIIAEDIKICLENNNYNVVALVDNAEHALLEIKNNTVDIVIIDIVIKGVLNGIDLAEIISVNYQIPFLFLTSNSDKKTIEKAIKVAPKAYITKPFTEADLFSSLALAFRVEKSQKSELREKDFFIIKVAGDFKKIYIKDLLYVKSDGNYLSIVTKTNEYLTRMSFKELLHIVNSNTIFQVQKSYLVNTLNVEKYNSNHVFLDTQKVPIGRSYKDRFFKVMESA
ncbi:LytR/AlgR family response regulator transcription factor [Polaribacter tangerinus]|uniref:LytR/AlgR family response regulator transcription factor n=1 Tax=Polaribacter tangerinus TaxID=1920034 RepID=UPI000B4BE0F7|nr:response regulator transcription factor [Polaribacter tangerinus]